MQPPTRKGVFCGVGAEWAVGGGVAVLRPFSPFSTLLANMQLGLLVEFYKAVSEC